MVIRYLKTISRIGDIAVLFKPALNAGRDNIFHLKLVGEWLLTAQSIHKDGGYAHSYSLTDGWAPSYPETSGYIIPTILKLGILLQDQRYAESAMRAGKWLLSIQSEDGSYTDLSGKKRVFDTGQIVEGLLGLYKHSGNKEYFEAALRAGDFLVRNQETDGSWSKFSYNGIAHTYYSRVAANLCYLYSESGREAFKSAAEKNIYWVVSKQRPNAYFGLMSFSAYEDPYLHTILYVIEGLLGYYKTMRDDRVLTCLKRTVETLVGINKNSEDILYSQYGSKWNVVNKQACLTGLAQWAGILLSMRQIGIGDDSYEDIANRTLEYLKARQIVYGSKNIAGAIPGSAPIWGSYSKFAFNNWTVKFFADALLRLEEIGENRAG